MTVRDEDALLRSVALQNAQSILLARQAAEEELIRTREALRESQERLAAALAAAGTGTFRWHAGSGAVEADGPFERLFGLAEGTGPHPFERILATVHPDDRADVVARSEAAFRTGQGLDLEFRVVRPDGGVHWIAQKWQFIHREGRGRYMTGACTDVTSRREAAAAHRASEERLRAIFNQASVGIAVADLDGRFVDMNARFSEVIGYPAEELRRKTFMDLTHADDREATRHAVADLLAGIIPEYTLEKRYLRPDGSVLWSRTSVTLLRDPEARPRQYIGVVEDITARKRAEAALRDETRMLELLNETGKSLASQLELQGLLQAITDAGTALSGARFGAFFYTTTNESGDALLLYTLSGAPREAFDRFGIPRATSLFGPTFRGEAPIRSDDVTKESKYGTMGPHHGMPRGHLPVRSYLAVPVRSRTGEVLGGLFFGHPDPGVFTERSERLMVGVAAQAGIAIDNARLYEAAQKAAGEREVLLERERAARSAAERMSSMKDEFLATLSHELRTPLNAILGWAQVLRSAPRETSDMMKGLETIERNARVQTQLIEDLLDMSRITSGKLRLDVEPLSLAAIIDAALETVRPAADAKGVRIDARLDPDAGPITGDPNRLQQVAWNLLSNAIKFTPRGGAVRVSLARAGGSVELKIEDTGIGIKPAFVPHLFERFRQADAATTRAFGGLGLGLSIVKNLVELHGGVVTAMSPGEGQGTAVTVTLPLRPAAPASAAARRQ